MLMPQKKRKQANCAQSDPEERRRARCRQDRKEDAEDFVDRRAADPGLDAEPAAGDERAQQGGNIGAARPERRPGKRRGTGIP